MDSVYILGAIALAIVASGALLTVRFSRSKTQTDSNKVVIRDVTTTGDVAGRDINKPK